MLGTVGTHKLYWSKVSQPLLRSLSFGGDTGQERPEGGREVGPFGLTDISIHTSLQTKARASGELQVPGRQVIF